MRNALKILALMFYLVNAYGSFAQTLSNKGKEFWVGYGHHQFMEISTTGGPRNSQEMVLYFSADDQPAHVVVTVKGSTYHEEYDVPANTVIQSKLIPKTYPNDFRLYSLPDTYGGTNSEGLFDKHGIHIESDVPIVAYAHIYGSMASGSTMLMPVDTWGYSYVSLNSRQIYNTNGARDCFSWVYVVAKENNTRVRIIPTGNTRGGLVANVPVDVDLQKGDIYQVLGASLTDDESIDLTGTKISSIANAQGACYPIAVFSGSSRTAITCTETSGSGDNLIQQLFPYQAWGKRYLTAPTSADMSPRVNNMNVFRIIVRDPNTIVKKNGQQLYGIRGFFYEYQSNQADYIEADQPIEVAQYIPSGNACSYVGLGDPEVMVISPIEQAIKKAGFYRNTRDNINVNYLTLIIPTAGLNSLKIDGLLNDFTYSYLHPNLPGYTVVIKKWNAEQKQCIVESDSAFTGITYGLGNAESYGYNMGTLINNLNGVPEIKNTYGSITNPVKYTCANTPVQLSVLMRYKPTRMLWRLSALNGILSPAIDIVDNAPVSAGTQVINGITYYRYILPQSYTFNTAGLYRIPLITTHPTVETCTNSEEIPYQVEVREALKTVFDIAYTNCKDTELINFSGKVLFDNGDSIRNWNWFFPDSTSASGQKVQHLFPAGAFQVKLRAISPEGCVVDTSKIFKLTEKPVASFSAPSDICQSQAVVIIDKSSIASGAIQSWNWSFGDGETASFPSNNGFSHSYASGKSYTIQLVAVSDNGCISDTSSQTVNVHSSPVAAFELPAAICMPGGSGTFKNQSGIADNTGLNYEWNFGDGSSIDTSSSPTHIYIAPGLYKVRLSATSTYGCKRDTIQALSAFYDKPLALFNVLSNELCQGIIARFTDLSTSVNSSINSWKWEFGDGRVSALQSPDKRYEIPGNYEVSLIVANVAGCISEPYNKQVVVYPQPVVDAGPSFVVPEGTMIRFKASVNDTNSFTYSWSPAGTLNSLAVLNPTLVALNDQTYTLTVTGQHNCNASDFLTVKILKTVKIPNAFSPNGDGVNDYWELSNLTDYPGVTVQVFNRNGQLIFNSIGYSTPWDGSCNGKPLPMGVYYYVIDRKNGFMPLSGSVTLVK